MKRFTLLALCVALPVRGDTTHHNVPEQVFHTLSQIEAAPTRAQLDQVFADSVAGLRALALDLAADAGVRIRAVRSLALYCTNDCASSPGRLAIVDAFDVVVPNGDGKSLLFLRACIEALGETRSRLDEDVSRVAPFLNHSSRDIRTVSARALGKLCNELAVGLLRGRLDTEPVPAVKHSIAQALQQLDVCN